MVEEIITALSRFKSLFVIARNSSFTFKGKAVDVKRSDASLACVMSLRGQCARQQGRFAANRGTGKCLSTMKPPLASIPVIACETIKMLSAPAA
jgi:adenylate cyclase